jgi:hypothetical protein
MPAYLPAHASTVQPKQGIVGLGTAKFDETSAHLTSACHREEIQQEQPAQIKTGY